MSTVLSTLVALIAIVNSQTYDDCGTETITVGGESLSVQLERDDSDNSMMRITLTGPTDKWFGFVLGAATMNGYAITAQGDTYELVERKVANPSPGSAMTSSGTVTADNSGSNGVVTLVRPYSFNSDADYFDFTDLMTCVDSSISIAGAIGSELSFAKHSNTLGSQTFTRTCDCASDSTAAPSAATNDPSMTPTASPVVVDNYELCATSELITDINLALYRDATNSMVRIQISGPNTQWFGYGFGSSGMIGAYAVTVEGDNANNLNVIQRILNQKSSPPGDTLTYGTSVSTTTEGTTVTGILEMAYDAAAEFDFTAFLTCEADSVDLIVATGSTTTMSQHGSTTSDRMGAKTLTRESSCTCGAVSTPTPTASANNIFNGFYIMLAVFMASLLN